MDFKRQIPTYTARRGTFEVLTVPAMQFLMLDGSGDPTTSTAYADALATILPVAYTLKFSSKGDLGRDYTVMPLEARWWAEDMATFTSALDKSRRSWTLLNMIPDWIAAEHLEIARRVVERKGGAPALEVVRLERFDEGLAGPTLHVGSYDEEGPVLEAMHHDVIPAQGLQMRGRHHEIYLSDPRRTAPAKLRTLPRQPVRVGADSRPPNVDCSVNDERLR